MCQQEGVDLLQIYYQKKEIGSHFFFQADSQKFQSSGFRVVYVLFRLQKKIVFTY